MTKVAVILNGYPQTTETFIAQELLGLERAGIGLTIHALERPANPIPNAINRAITAPVAYVPFPPLAPGQAIAAWRWATTLPDFATALGLLKRDLRERPAPLHVLRFAQACLFARTLGDADMIFAHFINRPAAVARYAAAMTGLPWACSAHAKDIFLQNQNDLAAKLAAARWTVTCSGHAFDRLIAAAPDRSRVHLQHHGLDLDRFAPLATDRPARTGAAPADAVRLLTVARIVPKKGLDTLVEALAMLPPDLCWTWTHAGGGDTGALARLAASRGVADRVRWLGSQPHEKIIELYRESDVFVLPCRQAPDGDRDGVPNVLVEAASQRLAIASSREPGVMELLDDGVSALLSAPDDAAALAAAMARLAKDPALRERLGAKAEARVRKEFDYRESTRFLAAMLERTASAA